MNVYADRRMFPGRDHTDEPVDLIAKSELDNSTRNSLFKSNMQKLSENAPLKLNENASTRRCFGGDVGLTVIMLTLFVASLGITIGLIVEIFSTEAMIFPATVVSDNKECSQFGADVVKSGGSAIDAAVVVYLCLSVVHPHVAGIGGGGFMLIREYSDANKTVSLDFREAVPLDASSSIDSSNPILSVGVPGTLHGLYTAHKLYGKVSWSSLVSRAAGLARNGFLVTPYLAQALSLGSVSSPAVWSLFPNMSRDDNLVGRRVKRENFADTLDLIAQFGVDVFYKGSVGKEFVEEIRSKGGLLTAQDLLNYSTVVSQPIRTKWRDFTVDSTPPPSSGIALLGTLQLLKKSHSNFDDLLQADEFTLNLLRRSASLFSTENFNAATKSSDFERWMNFLNDTMMDDKWSPMRNSAGSSVNIADGKYYVSLISGLGSWFGSQEVTSNGIVLNDALRDLPAYSLDSPHIKRVSSVGERPFSPFSSLILYDENEPCALRLVSSSSNSQLMLQVLFKYLNGNKSVAEAVEEPRFLFSGHDSVLFIEKGERLPTNVSSLVGLNITTIDAPFTSINVIAEVNDDVFAQADFRGGGAVAQV